MTDISKYKNVSLAKETYQKLDKIRRIIVPNTIVSRSQTLNILVNKEEKRLNGKAQEKAQSRPRLTTFTSCKLFLYKTLRINKS